MYKTIDYIKQLPEKKLIIDCKRSDIDSTSDAYAKAMFEYWDFDAITVVPFFGRDGIYPLFNIKTKVFLLFVNQVINLEEKSKIFFLKRQT